MYRNIYFNIRGDYEWGIGHSSQEAAETFRAEINSLFSDAGWQINRRDHSCGICDIAFRNRESLYLHPMQISGVILESSVPEIEGILAQARCFRPCGIVKGDEYVEMDDDAYRQYLDSRREEIRTAILTCCQTKRRNLYKTGDLSEYIASPFMLHRMGAKNLSSRYDDLSAAYVRDLIEEMVADGRLTAASTRYGRGLRTTGAAKPTKKKQRERQ